MANANEEQTLKLERYLDPSDVFYVDRISHYIKSKRNELKFTQSQLADFYDVNIHQICRMELGTQTTKLSSALRTIDEFSKKSEMSPVQLIAYLLKIPLNAENNVMGPNEISLLKAFGKVPPEIRRQYAELADISNVKFALALEIQTLPAPCLRKILDLVKSLLENM